MGAKENGHSVNAHNLLKTMEPSIGVEPTTFRLRIECSTN